MTLVIAANPRVEMKLDIWISSS